MHDSNCNCNIINEMKRTVMHSFLDGLKGSMVDAAGSL